MANHHPAPASDAAGAATPARPVAAPVDPAWLSARWAKRRPECPPLAHLYRGYYHDRWVRFHSLPGAKRYPDTPAERQTVLDRHNAVLDELMAGGDVLVVTTQYGWDPSPPPRDPELARLLPGAAYWTAVREHPELTAWSFLYASRLAWHPGCLDRLLAAVADERADNVTVADPALRRLYAPYDGGADAILATPAERDRLKARHAAWLSRHPQGL
jgi:hypothetical protein